VTEARRRLTEIIDRVLAGDRVVITRNGRPVVAIVPAPADPDAGTTPLGLAAFAGAVARRDELDDAVSAVVATRSVTRERETPDLV
jgi:antitoxin (DNA-binding transcriptional repressor) of toxin-antitoxin stability system